MSGGPVSFAPGALLNRIAKLRDILAGRHDASAAVAVPSSNGNGKHAPVAIEQKGIPQLPASMFWLLGSSPNDSETDSPLSIRRAYTATVLCYAAVTFRVQKVVEAPLIVVEDQDGGEAWLPDHDFARLIAEPNPDQDFAELLEETQTYLDIDGRALWLKIRDRAGRVARLRAFASDEFKVESTSDRLYGRFRIQTANGNRTHEAEDVVFFRYLDPNNRLEGLSPTEAALGHLELSDQLRRAVKSALKNMPMMGGVFSTPDGAPPLSDDQFTRLEAAIAQKFSGAANAGKPFLAEGLKYDKTAVTPAEMQMGELWREVEAAVCMAYRTRPEILGASIGLENSPWSHMKTARGLTYEDAIIPLWRRMERTIQRQLFRPDFEENLRRSIRFDTSAIPALQEDQLERSRVANINRTIWTRNERRVYTGMDPDDSPAGDEYETAGTAAAPTESASLRTQLLQAKGAKATDPDTIWRVFDASTKAAEAGWERAAAQLLARDREEAQRLLAMHVGTQKAEDDTVEASTTQAFLSAFVAYLAGASATTWRARIRPLLRAGGTQEVRRLAARLGISFDLLRPGLLEYVEDEAAWLIRELGSTTRDAVTAAVRQSIEKGESIDQLTRRIEELGGFARSRARMIARTETTRAANGASRRSLSHFAETSGRTVTKTWISSRDDRVRPEHAELDGEQAGVDAEFSNGRTEPGEPNCRCTLTYSVSEEI